MSYLEVLRIGEVVSIGFGEKIQGIIMEIAISKDGVMYKVVWWNGRERNEEWVMACEIEAGLGVDRQKIGYK
jgi:hypothetical protein